MRYGQIFGATLSRVYRLGWLGRPVWPGRIEWVGQLVSASLIAVTLFCLAGCANILAAPAPASIRILSYNTQNLFDDHKDGGEYPEFIPGGSLGWNRESYRQRLERLATVIRDQAGLPDIIVLEEIESAKVLEDLCADFLPPNSYSVRLIQADQGLIHLGLLSKLPVQAQRSHRIWQESENCRSVWELHFGVDGAWQLAVLANHWKSKSGGEAASEALRIQAAKVLRQRGRELLAGQPDLDLIACGDFNEILHQPSDALVKAKAGRGRGQAKGLIASLGQRRTSPRPKTQPSLTQLQAQGQTLPYADALNPRFALGRARASLTAADYGQCALWVIPWSQRQTMGGDWLSPYSPDNCDSAGNPGSYRYQGKWEAIDHFLLARGLANTAGLGYQDFKVLGHPALLDGEGNPWRYDSRSGQGFSDHLPILLELAIAGK